MTSLAIKALSFNPTIIPANRVITNVGHIGGSTSEPSSLGLG